MPIERLADELARKIAAGEVIDRPVSVVKELVENALDASSTAIEIEIVAGGLRRVVVRDDGDGMSREDLALCAERHATSKIHTEADLSSLRTLGFRGEALASIAAVSRLRIISRERAALDAWELHSVAGQTDAIVPGARGPGTTVEVQDLFFNLPARARFLGAPRTEALHVHRVVERLALANPKVGFVLRHDEREVFAAPSVKTLLERAAQVYGVETAEDLIPLDGRRGDIRVTGCVSGRDVKRGTRRDQLFLVNGRAVTDRGLGYVLASAYSGILRPGSYPIAVVGVELPPDLVDVNVHPRKEEVRFAVSRDIQDAVAAALQQALSSSRMVGRLSERPAGMDGPSWSTVDRVRDGGERGTANSLFPGFGSRGHVEMARGIGDVRIESDRRVIGQLDDTYLLVQAPDALEIVDQHILHERVLYERLRAELAGEGIVRQLFLLPARIELPFEAAAVLSANLAALARVGVVIEEFGGGTYLLREYPQRLADEQTSRGFQSVVEAIVDVLRDEGDIERALFDDVLSALACGAAVKAGERLPLIEAQALVDQLWKTENPFSCPHGRPIIVRVERAELDRRFGR